MVRKISLSASPRSNTWQTLGWVTWRAMRTSLTSRVRWARSAWRGPESVNSLIATGSSSTRSSEDLVHATAAELGYDAIAAGEDVACLEACPLAASGSGVAPRLPHRRLFLVVVGEQGLDLTAALVVAGAGASARKARRSTAERSQAARKSSLTQAWRSSLT